MPNRIKWCLVKLPDDLGVFHVGGKTGARFGPDSFEICFNKFRGKFDAHASLARVFEFGDEGRTGKIRDHLEAAASLVRDAHAEAPLSIVIGGGHDFGYAQLRGVRAAIAPAPSAPATAALPKLGCINLDAHFDLRKPAPEITSGSPYFLALEERLVDGPDLIEFGIQSHCNAYELWERADRAGVETIPFRSARSETDPETAVEKFARALSALATRVDAIVLSFDLDCVAEAYAPGVSAPVAEGFTPDEVFAMARIAAREPKVVSLGIFELNPLYDRDRQTARLAAKFAHAFLESRSTVTPELP